MFTFTRKEPKRKYVHGIATTHHVKKIQFTVEADADLPEMCDAFEHFLRACGYDFTGNVEIVEKPSQTISYEEIDWSNLPKQ